MRSATLLCALLAFAPAALGQTTHTVPLVFSTDEAATPESLKGWAELSLHLARSEARLTVSSLEELIEPSAAEARAQALARGVAALRRGEALRKSEGLAAARPAYVQAAELLAAADWRLGFEQLLTAQSWKAAATGEQQDAALLFTLRPTFAFPSGVLDPALETQLAEQRAGKAKAARTTFEVRSDVPAVVWVDGVLIGVTPVTAPEVVAGRHFITAAAPGYQLRQTEELVGPGSTVDLALEDTPSGPAVRSALAELGAYFRTGGSKPPLLLFKVLEVTEILAIGLGSGGEARAVRFDQPGRFATASRRLAPARLRAELLALSRDACDAPLRSEEPKVAAAAPPLPVVVAPAPPSPSATGGKGGGVSLVVLGGIGALAGGGLVGWSFAEAGDAQLTIPQTEETLYEEAIQGARLKAAIGYGVAGAGVVTALIGVIVLASSGPSQPAAAPKQDEVTVRLVPGPGSLSLVGQF